ncbi:hypothetical protein ACHAXH_009957 [Discostella pseudostelligera]
MERSVFETRKSGCWEGGKEIQAYINVATH